MLTTNEIKLLLESAGVSEEDCAIIEQHGNILKEAQDFLLQKLDASAQVIEVIIATKNKAKIESKITANTTESDLIPILSESMKEVFEEYDYSKSAEVCSAITEILTIAKKYGSF
jgi:DNA-directed RNA polymerase subunit F